MKTPFQIFVKKKFGGRQEFADRMHISHPTATKYMTDPLSMSVRMFYTVCKECDTSIFEVIEIINESYK